MDYDKSATRIDSPVAWLVGRRFQTLAKREFNWACSFDDGASLRIACLWRLIESDQIRFTSLDDGHKFGLPVPVDAASEVNHRLAGATIELVELRKDVLDLEFRFSSGHRFQVIPDSSGYEAWEAAWGSKEVIAVGGGKLAIWG